MIPVLWHTLALGNPQFLSDVLFELAQLIGLPHAVILNYFLWQHKVKKSLMKV